MSREASLFKPERKFSRGIRSWIRCNRTVRSDRWYFFQTFDAQRRWNRMVWSDLWRISQIFSHNDEPGYCVSEYDFFSIGWCVLCWQQKRQMREHLPNSWYSWNGGWQQSLFKNQLFQFLCKRQYYAQQLRAPSLYGIFHPFGVYVCDCVWCQR